MPAARQASRNSVAETFFGHRPPSDASNEAEVAAWTSGQRLDERWWNGQRHLRIRLFRLEVSHAITNMPPSNPRRIPAPQAGIKQHIELYPLPRT